VNRINQDVQIFSPLPCIYAMLLKKKTKNISQILWVCLLQILTKSHSSTWVTKGFKRFVACVKCNRYSYDSKLGF